MACKDLYDKYQKIVVKPDKTELENLFKKITYDLVQKDQQTEYIYRMLKHFLELQRFSDIYKTVIHQIQSNIISQSFLPDREYFDFFMLMNEYVLHNKTQTKFDDHQGRKIALDQLGNYLYQKGLYLMKGCSDHALECFVFSHSLGHARALEYIIPLCIYNGRLATLFSLPNTHQHEFVDLIKKGDYQQYETLLDSNQAQLVDQQTYQFYARGIMMSEISAAKQSGHDVNDIIRRSKKLMISDEVHVFETLDDYYEGKSPQYLQPQLQGIIKPEQLGQFTELVQKLII